MIVFLQCRQTYTLQSARKQQRNIHLGSILMKSTCYDRKTMDNFKYDKGGTANSNCAPAYAHWAAGDEQSWRRAHAHSSGGIRRTRLRRLRRDIDMNEFFKNTSISSERLDDNPMRPHLCQKAP